MVRVKFNKTLGILSLAATFLFCVGYGNQQKVAANTKRMSREQDMPSLGVDNPLKGLSKFTVIFMLPYSSKDQSDKIRSFVENELNKYGESSDLNLIVKNKDEESVDLSQLGSDGILIYELGNITDITGKELAVVRASLNLSNIVTISKTNQEISTYIWSNNCFSQFSLGKNLEKIVRDSFAHQMKAFMEDYSLVNSNKPTFNVYIP